METIRSVKITVEVDTNKKTYQKEFSLDDLDEMIDWLREYADVHVCHEYLCSLDYPR